MNSSVFSRGMMPLWIGLFFMAILLVGVYFTQQKKHSQKNQQTVFQAEIPMVQATGKSEFENQIRQELNLHLQNKEWALALSNINQLDSLNPQSTEFIEIKARLLQENKETKDLAKLDSPHFYISTEADAAYSYVEPLSAILESQFELLSTLMVFSPAQKISVVLYENKTYGGGANTQNWVEAAFDGKLRIPVAVMKKSDTERSAILIHELTHAFLWEIGKNQIPFWLNEGLAQYAEKKSLRYDSTFKPVYFVDLNKSFGDHADVNYVNNLYRTSLAMTNSLMTQGDWSKMNQLLTQLRQGSDFGSSVLSVYKLNESQIFDLANTQLATPF